ncbi:MAG: hypothetical protein IMW99_00115 [Firmicutes bacterium]|nr:hypothetical protein [Bacillota bacterium]
MYFTTHALAGAVAGSLVANPAAGFVLGMASHAALDSVPHHDYDGPKAALLDVAVGAGLLLAVLPAVSGHPLPSAALWGALGGILPDAEVVAGYLAKKHGRRWPMLFPSHTGLLPHKNLPWPQGFWLQVLLDVALFLLLATA